MKKEFALILLLVLEAIPALIPAPARATPLLRKILDVPLPGGTYRFDYQSLDSAGARLFISHMRADELIVFDTKENRVKANIPGFSTVTGVLYVPALRRLYASAAGSGELIVLDPDKLEVVKKISVGRFPDGIAYAADFGKIFVSDETGGADIVVDAASNQLLKKIPLGSDVGNTQYDAAGRKIVVAVGSTNELLVIDPGSEEIVSRLPLQGADGAHGLYIDSERRLAFVACEGNAKLFVIDLREMKVMASFEVGEDPDVLAFDTGMRRLYVASESGTLSIFDEKGAGVVKRGDVLIDENAHSVAVDSESHRLYFPLKNVDGKPLLRIMEPAPQ